MNATRPLVHPIEAPPFHAGGGAAAENPMPQGRMEDIPGMAGTRGGLTLRLNQFAFAFISLSVMTSTIHSHNYTAFYYLVAAVSLQCLWSLSLAIVDVYALSVKRRLRNPKVVSVFAVGDWISSTLTFAAASASAGVAVYTGSDMKSCVFGICCRYQASIAMAFLSWIAVSPSFILNFWTLASK